MIMPTIAGEIPALLRPLKAGAQMPLSGVTTLAATAVRVFIVSRSSLERQR